MSKRNKISVVSQLFSSGKGLAAMSVILLLLGATIVVLFPNITFRPDDSQSLAWRPTSNARAFVQGGFFPWYQGGGIQDANLGVYVERAGGQQRFGMIAESMVQSASEVSSKMSSEEAVTLAKSHSKVAEFLEAHPVSDEGAFFDGQFWHVNFYASNAEWDAWAYVMIKDEDKEITQVYIVDGDEVYLEWPNADLSIDQVVDIVLNDPFTTEFMEAFNLTILDSWIWFDGNDEWYISFWGWKVLNEAIEEGTPSDSRVSVPSFGDALSPSIPETELDTAMIIFSGFWLTDLVSDDEAAITSTLTNYYNFSTVQHSREEILQHVMNLDATADFMERNENDSYLSSNDYLKIIHEPSGNIKIQWWLEFYAWPGVLYIAAGVSPSAFQVELSAASSISLDGLPQEISPEATKNVPTFQSHQNPPPPTTSLPEGIINLYKWTFDYLTIGINDATLEIAFLDTARQPNHDAIDVISEVVTNNNDVQQFVTEMEESYAYLSYDPFVGTWYLSLTPSWTYLSYSWGSINDTDLSIIELNIQHIPEELRPNMSLSEVQALINNLTAVNEFNATYSPYGEIQTWIYYEPYYWYWDYGDASYNNGTTSPEEPNVPSTKAWTAWISSSVISEAWIYITINDTSGEFYLDEGEPSIMPTLLPSEVLNITLQLPEVINFTEQYPSHDVYLSYYSGTWDVYYSHYQFNDFAYVYVIINDATATVSEVYAYP